MIKEIINNYLKNNNISDYKIISKYLTFSEIVASANTPILLGNSVMFIYEFICQGIISDSSDLSMNLLILKSDTFISQQIDYKQLVRYSSFGQATECFSDFISIHQNRFSVSYDPTDCIFSEIYNMNIKYYSLTKIF